MEFVTLVDVDDKQIGGIEKLKAHQEGALHRAFSIFVFNNSNEVLLQKRASRKYHSANLWSNTCGHPRPEEDVVLAAHRRLTEEMGFDCDLIETGTYKYSADLDKNLKENEIDHIFLGHYEGRINPNPDEVQDVSWKGIEELREHIKNSPELYTVWLKLILSDHPEMLKFSR